MKRVLTVCAALALMVAMTLPASASSGGSGLTMAGALNGEGVMVQAPAVVCNDGGTCRVITDASVNASGAASYAVLINGSQVDMFYEQDLAEDLAVFTVDAAYLSAPGVLNLAQSIQVEEELIYYFVYPQDGSLVVQEGSARVMEEDGRLMFSRTLPSGADEANVYYPAIAVNRAGELAVIEGQQSIKRLCSIENGGAAPTPAPAPTQTPGGSNPTNPPKGRDDPDPTPAPTPGPGPNPPLSMETIAAIVIAVILVAGGIAIFLKKRNSGGSNPPVQPLVQPIAPTEPMEPVRPAQPVPDSPEHIKPVEIKPKSSALYLCCEGGVMDGRRYPVGTTTILIGRDPSCSIRYPADTKGVSRRHCEIFWKNGVLNIMDLGSTSGTFIRGKGQIAANVPVAVNAGDTFYLGEKRNAFVIRMGE